MRKQEHFDRQIRAVFRCLDVCKLAHEAAIRDIENTQRMVLVLASNVDLRNISSPNALAHSIRELRICLWEAPYIITETGWGEPLSRTGSVYLMNPKCKYLVVRYRI